MHGSPQQPDPYRAGGVPDAPLEIGSIVRRNTLRALSGAGEPGSALRIEGEPFLRRRVRASVEGALARARQETRVDDSEHVARVAFLREAGVSAGVHPDDVQRVSELHAAYAEKLPKGGGIWPLTTVLFALVAAAGLGVAYKKFGPNAEERFRKTDFGVALADPLTEYVVAAGKSPDELPAKKSAVLNDGVKKQLGPELFAKFGDVLDQTVAATDAETDALRTALESFNDGLTTAKIPGFIDSYASPNNKGGHTVWLMSFFTNDRAEVTFDGESMRVAWARRIDSLNIDTTFYVWNREKSRWSVVSLEQVEAKFGRELLPAIGRADGKLHYGDDFGGTNTARLTKALAGPLRDAFVAESGVKPDELETVQDIVASLLEASLRVKSKSGLLVAHGSLLVPPQELKRMQKHREKNLDLDDALKAHERLTGHREALEKLVAIAADVDEATFVGEHLLVKKKTEPTDEARAAGLSSAYGVAVASTRLALLADGKHAPSIYLEDMTRDIITRGNGPANVVVRELARELGRKLPEGAVESSTEAFLNNIEFLVGKPRDAIADAARRVHQRLFGKAPPHYERARI